MSYELMRVTQLVFALSLMFGAFLGGIAVGWWRWGRSAEEPRGMTATMETPAARPRVSPDLFTPAEMGERPPSPVSVGAGVGGPPPALPPSAEMLPGDPVV